jgi:excisionase family DNA binding protein
MADLLTIDQVAERLQVNPETVRRWLLAEKLKGAKLAGNLWRIREADLIEFINTKAA